MFVIHFASTAVYNIVMYPYVSHCMLWNKCVLFIFLVMCYRQSSRKKIHIFINRIQTTLENYYFRQMESVCRTIRLLFILKRILGLYVFVKPHHSAILLQNLCFIFYYYYFYYLCAVPFANQ